MSDETMSAHEFNSDVPVCVSEKIALARSGEPKISAVSTETLQDTSLNHPQTIRCRVVALAPNNWDGQWMNRQQILSRLAKKHDILYCTGPWTVWDRNTERFKVSSWLGGFERRDGVLLDRPPKLLLAWPTLAIENRMVIRASVARWRRELDKMGNGPLIAYIFHPKYFRYAEQLRPDLLVYNPYEMFSRTPSWTTESAAEERCLLNTCDLVIASSEPTSAALQSQTSKSVYCVPNGADAGYFESAASEPPPEDLAAIPHPRIGYVGSLNRKVDFRLISNLAGAEPDWHFVLIGPVGNLDDESRVAFDECRQRPNVHLLEARPHTELPRCMGGLDVALLCYRRDSWADFGFPLKLYEYLAVGLPVVSTALRSILDCREFLDIAEDESSWREAISRALAGHGRSTPDARRAEARRNTWDVRVATIDRLLGAALRGAFPRPPRSVDNGRTSQPLLTDAASTPRGE